jgi:predicted O-methyltransferase YrrM
MDPVEQYVTSLFAPEDERLIALREEADRSGLPPIAISADTGRLLQVLMSAVGARRVLEVGTLGGYSTIWMARALPPDGEIVTIEADRRHAEFAERHFARANVARKVNLRVGKAMDILPSLDGERFDLAFLDADKAPLPRYLDWALRLVRQGGFIVADNALWGGRVYDERVDDEDTRGVREFNRRIASDPRLRSIIVPTHDGVAIAVVAGAPAA